MKKRCLNLRCIVFCSTILMLIIFCLSPFLVTSNLGQQLLKYPEEKGQVGDIFSGISGTLIAIVGVLVSIFLAFYEYELNKLQKDEFEKQYKDTKIQRFENKFFELLKIHKENVDSMKIKTYGNQTLQSQKIFVEMFKEFKLIYKITDKVLKKSEILNSYSVIDKIIISYTFFYIGSKKDYKFIYNIISNSNNNKLDNDIKTINENLKYYSLNPHLYGFEIRLKYKPFEGHLSHIGHYYRNLWTIIKFIDNQDFLFKEKYLYAKILRSLLSPHEQLLLLLNTLTPYGTVWINETPNFNDEFLKKDFKNQKEFEENLLLEFNEKSNIKNNKSSLYNYYKNKDNKKFKDNLNRNYTPKGCLLKYKLIKNFPLGLLKEIDSDLEYYINKKFPNEDYSYEWNKIKKHSFNQIYIYTFRVEN